MGRKKLNLIGRKFGRLTAVRGLEKRQGGDVIWLCRCDCGNLTEVRTSHLRNGGIKSCGCLREEWMSELGSRQRGESHPAYRHGDFINRKPSRLYKTWINMKTRCYNSNGEIYRRYGGRDIHICNEWRNDFMAFRDWALANGYQDNLTIDKINNDDDYSPKNCQWLTRVENIKKYWRKDAKIQTP